MIVELEFSVDPLRAAFLGPCARPSEQVRGGRRQLGKVIVDRVSRIVRIHHGRNKLVEVVHAGNFDMALIAEEISFVADQVFAVRKIQHQFFMIQMDQVFQMILRAPLGLHAKETVTEDAAPDVPVICLHLPSFGGHLRSEEKRQIRLQIVAFLLAKLIQQSRSPWHEAGIVRLVTEEAKHRGSEFVAEESLVDFVRSFQKRFCCFRIQIIDQRVQAVFRVRAVGAIDIARGWAAKYVANEFDLPVSVRRRRPFDLTIHDRQRLGCSLWRSHRGAQCRAHSHRLPHTRRRHPGRRGQIHSHRSQSIHWYRHSNPSAQARW